MRPLQVLCAIASALLLAAFWIAARSHGGFSDAPFVMPPTDHPLTLASARFLRPNEIALYAWSAALLLPAAALAARALGGLDLLERAAGALLADRRSAPVLAAALATAGSAVIAWAVVGHVPLLDDERAYVLQAVQLAHGRVGDPAMPDAFRNNMLLTHPLLTAKYTPGNALVMVPGVWLGVVGLVHPLLAGLGAVGVWGLSREAAGDRVAALAAFVWALSPTVWCIGGSTLAFGTAATALALALWLFARADRTAGVGAGFGAGASMGWLFLTRPLEAAFVGAAIALWLVIRARAARRASRILAPAAGFASVAWVLLWHNRAVTGSAWVLPYSLDTYKFSLGFTHSFGTAYQHTPFSALMNLLTSAVRVDSWTLGVPGALAIATVGLLRKTSSPTGSLLRLCALAIVAMLVVLPSPGTWDVGPTYAFIGMPIVACAIACGAQWAMTRLAPPWRARVGGALLAMMLGGALATTPLRVARLAALADAIDAPWQFVAASAIGEAALVVPPGKLRAAPGWSFGYPYTIPTGPDTRAHLFEPLNRREYDEAIARFPNLPVFTVRIDRVRFAQTGERVYRMFLFDPNVFGPK